MTRLNFSKPLSLAVVIVLASPLAMADDKAGWYIGGSLGGTLANIDHSDIKKGLTAGGFTTTSLKSSENDIGFKLLGGYQFNEIVAIEGGYFNLGKFDYKANTLPLGSLKGDIKVQGIHIDVVGTWFFTEEFALLARVGAIHTKAEASFKGSGAVTPATSKSSKDDTNFKVGLGLQYSVTPALNIRTELERYRVNDSIATKGDIDLISLGVTYRFGTKRNKVVEEKVVVVAVAPPVEKKVEKVVVAKKVVVITFDDVHFEFDQSRLSKDTQKVMDENIAQLKKNPNSTVLIEGYTSASGTDAYNQNLSEKRAKAVKDYLVKGGIKEERLSTIGYGHTNPAEYEKKPKELRSPAAKANMRVLFQVLVK